MARKTTERRRLIKFSNYSMCITLPKWVIDQLGWQKGEELILHTDVKQGKITLTHADSKEKNSNSENPKDDNTNGNDDLKPIPKLRW